MDRLKDKVKELETKMIRDIIIKLNDKYSKEANMVFEACLDELESRMQEEEFITFCELL